MPDKIDGKWKTWNPVIGFLHGCSYCWAKRFALERLSNTEKYKNGFAPKLAGNELNKRFRNQFVFVSDMGDLFGEWVPKEWILKVIDATRQSPSSDFLFLTKNPNRYKEFIHLCRNNIVLGATIETNRSNDLSRVPPVAERAKAMIDLSYPRKFISIEPIMDFDLEIFAKWIEDIAPIQVSVGYDNWNNRLPEPPLAKTLQFIEKLNEFTEVRERKLREAWRISNVARARLKVSGFLIMQCIKESSTLRLSSKGDKPFPRVVFRFGKEDGEISWYLKYRGTVRKIERKIGRGGVF